MSIGSNAHGGSGIQTMSLGENIGYSAKNLPNKLPLNTEEKSSPYIVKPEALGNRQASSLLDVRICGRNSQESGDRNTLELLLVLS